jgi:hypothetical protein
MAKKKTGGVTELAKAARHRFDDARAFVAAQRWRGAMNLAGYAVECLLKTKLMQRFRCRNLMEWEADLRKRRRLQRLSSLFTHELILLINLLDCRERLQASPNAWRYFTYVNQWSPSWRYHADLASEALRRILSLRRRTSSAGSMQIPRETLA